MAYTSRTTGYSARVPEDDRSMVDSLRKVFEAGQHLVLDRLDLMRWDVTAGAGRTVRGGVMVAAGGLLLAGAGFMVLAAIAALLARVMPASAAIMLVAGATALVALAVMTIGVRRTHVEQEFSITRDLAGEVRNRGESR